jgi:hypothetical protein
MSDNTAATTVSIRDAIEAAMPDEEPVNQSAPRSEPVSEPSSAPVKPESSSNIEEPTFDFDNASEEETESEEPVLAEKPNVKEKKLDAIKPGPKAAPKSTEKAPVSWKPEIREHWEKLPHVVRTEIARREREVQSALKETAETRKYADEITRVMQPYEMFIKAENSNHAQAINNVMSTAARLRTGTAPDIANLIAGIVKQYGVGRFGRNFIEQLDSALIGQVPEQDANVAAMQQAVQQQLAPVQQFMSQFQQAQAQQQQRTMQEAQTEVEGFLSNAEFAEDVREDMADLMEVAQRRGREISLQDAYRQACIANPRVRVVLEQRSKARGAQQLSGAARKAKSAAVSVSGGPSLAAPQAQATDIRSAIEAAIASHSR